MAGYAGSTYAGSPYAGAAAATPPSDVTGTLSGSFPQFAGSLSGNVFEPGLSGFLTGSFPALEGEFFGDLLTSTSGLVLADASTSTVAPPVEVLPEAVVQHIVTPTVPVPVLAGGRPQ